MDDDPQQEHVFVNALAMRQGGEIVRGQLSISIYKIGAVGTSISLNNPLTNIQSLAVKVSGQKLFLSALIHTAPYTHSPHLFILSVDNHY